jgi:hypothetical protein
MGRTLLDGTARQGRHPARLWTFYPHFQPGSSPFYPPPEPLASTFRPPCADTRRPAFRIIPSPPPRTPSPPRTPDPPWPFSPSLRSALAHPGCYDVSGAAAPLPAPATNSAAVAGNAATLSHCADPQAGQQRRAPQAASAPLPSPPTTI